MLSRILRRSLLESSTSILPPTFLLPIRAHLSTAPQTTSTTTSPSPSSLLPNSAHASSAKPQPASNARAAQSTQKPSNPAPISIPQSTSSTLGTTAAASTPTRALHSSIRTLLPLLRSQPPFYITLQIHGKSYLLQRGDVLRLPFHMRSVNPGDILRLNCATVIGSRDFTLRAAASTKGTREGPAVRRYLDERLFVCRATVVGTESEPMRIKEKTKRRQRHVRQVKSKHRYTVLRISEVEVKAVEEVERLNEERGLEGDVVGMEGDVLLDGQGVEETVVEQNLPGKVDA